MSPECKIETWLSLCSWLAEKKLQGHRNRGRLRSYSELCRFDSQPRGIHEAKVLYVRTVEALQEAAQSLATAAVIGVDVEHNHMRSYRGIVCLLQLHAGPSLTIL